MNFSFGHCEQRFFLLLNENSNQFNGTIWFNYDTKCVTFVSWSIKMKEMKRKKCEYKCRNCLFEQKLSLFCLFFSSFWMNNRQFRIIIKFVMVNVTTYILISINSMNLRFSNQISLIFKNRKIFQSKSHSMQNFIQVKPDFIKQNICLIVFSNKND